MSMTRTDRQRALARALRRFETVVRDAGHSDPQPAGDQPAQEARPVEREQESRS
jgi:hypothetical protein